MQILQFNHIITKLMPIALIFNSIASADLAPSDTAPEFSRKDQNGKIVHLSDFRGKYVLLYFYPKDDTPGCTKEACSFRDQYSRLRKLDTVIFGVSQQDEKSHQAFRAKHKLPFDLLVDEDGKLADSYGVKKMPILGLTRRESILIDPRGKILRIYRDVDPSQHVQEVIHDIQLAR